MVDLHVEPVATDDVAPGELISVRLSSLGETGAAEFIIDRTGDDAVVATNADGMTALLRRVAMETPSESELLSAQLTMDAADPVYEMSLRSAAIMLAGVARSRRVTRFRVLPDAGAVAEATADRFVAAARGAIEANGVFRVALSGGSTPKAVYPLILEPARRDTVDWSRVEFFWGDERAVPPDDPESNFGVAYQMLIAQLPNVRPDLVHRMPAEAPDIDAAALSYEGELRLAFGARGSEPPAFDLIWLGMGPDGHLASLFPGTLALEEAERWVVGNWVPSMETWRMTLTFPVLNAGRRVIFAVTGADKAATLRAAFAPVARACPRSRWRAGAWNGSSTPPRPASAGTPDRCRTLAWLTIALVFGAAAIGFGQPAWRSYRARESRDLNTERYRAWRGHSVRGQPAPTRRGDDGRGAPPDLRRRGVRRHRARRRSSHSS